MENTIKTETEQDRYYVSFKNPQTGEPDKLWFPTERSRSAFMEDYKSDFPTMASTIEQWFVSRVIEVGACPNHEGHVPVIISRCGGPSPRALNVCGHCGSAIAPLGNLQSNPLWVAISDQEEDRIRAAAKGNWCYVCDRPKTDCACVENGGSY